MHAHNDSRIVTANARAAFLARFEDEVDPTRILSEPERVTMRESLCACIA